MIYYRALSSGEVNKTGRLHFDAESIAGERTVKAAGHEGVRVRLMTYLGNTRIRMPIDIGFGDLVVPGSSIVKLPVPLDLPRLKCRDTAARVQLPNKQG